MIKLVGSIVNRMLRSVGFEIRMVGSRIPGRQISYPEIERFLYFKRLFDLVKDVEGDIVECGVAQGHSLLYLAILVKQEMKGRKLWGFDSFEGFPEPSEEDKSIRKVKKGELGGTRVWGVRDLLIWARLDAYFVDTQITLVKGFFNESLSKYKGSAIALLHVDVDLYHSYRTVLKELYPKVSVGGVVLFDEYMDIRSQVNFPGACKAIDEYFGDNISLISRDKTTGQYYLIKRQT